MRQSLQTIAKRLWNMVSQSAMYGDGDNIASANASSQWEVPWRANKKLALTSGSDITFQKKLIFTKKCFYLLFFIDIVFVCYYFTSDTFIFRVFFQVGFKVYVVVEWTFRFQKLVNKSDVTILIWLSNKIILILPPPQPHNCPALIEH